MSWPESIEFYFRYRKEERKENREEETFILILYISILKNIYDLFIYRYIQMIYLYVHLIFKH